MMSPFDMLHIACCCKKIMGLCHGHAMMSVWEESKCILSVSLMPNSIDLEA
jgi:hypothetical protein